MKRRLFNLLALTSLVLCVGVVVLWVRSYWIADIVTWLSASQNETQMIWGGTSLAAESGGLVVFGWTSRDSEGGASGKLFPRNRELLWRSSTPGWEWPRGRLGFVWFDRSEQQRTLPFVHKTSEWQVRVPFWAMVLLLCLSPAVWLIRRHEWLARERILKGLCVRCGYDLRASQDRCPECGTALSRSTTTGR